MLRTAASSIRAGFGIGICQAALARRDPDLECVLPGAFQLKLGVWLAMHENLRSTPRCRAVFDALAANLKSHVIEEIGGGPVPIATGRPGA